MRCQGGTQKQSSRYRIVAQKHGALTPRIQSTAGGAHKAVKRWPGMPTHREGALDRQRLPLPDPHWKVPFSRTEPGTEV